MRFFPRAPRRRAAVAVAIAAIMCTTVAPYATADDDLKGKQRQVRKQLSKAHTQLDETSASLRRANAAVVTSQRRLSVARGELASAKGKLLAAKAKDVRMQAELTTAEGELETANTELKQGRDDLQSQQDVVTQTVLRNFTDGDPQLKFISSYLDGESLEDLQRLVIADRVVVDSEETEYDALDTAEQQLEARRERVRTAKQAVQAAREKAAANLDTMSTLFDRTRAAKQSVDGLVVDNRRAKKQAVAAKARDLTILKKLEKREQRIRQQILAKARATKGGTFSGDTGGLLTMPVAGGYVTSPYGYRTHPIYGYYSLHDGTDFGKGCGAPLVAAADGTVIDRSYSSSYGNRLFLSIGTVNGANVTLIYNHASGYRVGEGARVKRGQVIGSMGTTGWSTGCHLHFTVLRDGATVDPMGYL